MKIGFIGIGGLILWLCLAAMLNGIAEDGVSLRFRLITLPLPRGCNTDIGGTVSSWLSLCTERRISV